MSIGTYQLDETLIVDFTTSDPTNDGVISDADAAPDIEIYEDGGSTPIFTTTATKRDAGTTGQYTFSALLSAANGFELGKVYNVHALATVSLVDGGKAIANFRMGTPVIYIG